MEGSDMLLSDSLHIYCNDLRETIEFFFAEPFSYNEEVVQELMDIFDRLELLEMKLNDLDYTGSFRY